MFFIYIDNQETLGLIFSFNIEHLVSAKTAGLQAVDMFCWGIFRKYERQDAV